VKAIEGLIVASIYDHCESVWFKDVCQPNGKLRPAYTAGKCKNAAGALVVPGPAVIQDCWFGHQVPLLLILKDHHFARAVSRL
jgi:hypothetical protein